MELFRILYEPVNISKHTFEKLKKASEIWQKLSHQMSMNEKFILKTF